MRKIKLLTSLATLPVLGAVCLPLTSCDVEARIVINCSSKSVTFTDLPKIYKNGSGDISATYTYDTTKYKFDEANSDILVAAKSIKSSEGVEYKDGKVIIPASLITGPVAVKILVVEKANHSIVNESSEAVTISGLNEIWYEGDGDISATYTVDSSVQFDAENSDILVDSISIKNQTGVVYTNGTIKIPSSLIIGTITIKIATSVKPGQLSNTIDEIISACNTYEKSSRSTAAKKAFIQSFKINDVPVTSIDSIIGSTFNITINTKEHVVRIIDFEHDDIYDETTKITTGKAALTFELMTLLSTDVGNRKLTKWDDTSCCDYPNSVLRKNLTGKGDATQTFTDTALSMLSNELQTNIKTVQKTVAQSSDSGSSYVVSSYTDTLFPLSYTEMALSQYVDYRVRKTEGSVYKYWKDNFSNKESRIKQDINGNKLNYWLVSPMSVPTTHTDAWTIDVDGDLDYGKYVTDDAAVTFAFCI